MADIEKVIKGLEYCIKSEDCRGCIYWEEIGLHEGCPLNSDALELLKKQEPMKPTVHGTWTDGFTTYDAYYCKSCNGLLQKNDWQFCPWCGQAVKW